MQRYLSCSPLVPSSTRAVQVDTCRQGGICQAPSTAAFTSFCQESVAITALIGTIACLLRATALIDFLVLQLVVHGRSMLSAGGGISFNVTEPFPSLWPWHCVVHAPVVAVGNRCRAEHGTSCTMPRVWQLVRRDPCYLVVPMWSGLSLSSQGST